MFRANSISMLKSKSVLKVLLLGVLCLVCGVLISFDYDKDPAKDGEELTVQKKMYWSNQHKLTSWYNALGLENPNFFEVRDQFVSYFENRPYVKTEAVKEYKKYIAKNFPNIDANGNYIEPISSEVNLRKKPKAGNKWKQIFLKWNTRQDNSGVGVLRSIRIKPDEPTTVLAGAATAGIWMTENAGEDWSLVSNDVPEVEWVNEIVYSRKDPKVVYAATNIGVIKSVNGGNSWDYTALKKTFPDKFGSLLWVDVSSVSSDLVYATTEEKGAYTLHVSEDGGDSWSEKYKTTNKIWDMRVKPNDPKIVYILEVSEKTKWINFKRSIDGGQTFEVVSEGFPADHNTKAHRARLGTTPANNEVVYIAIGFNGGRDKDMISFFKSSDAGKSFSKNCCGNSEEPLVNAMGTTDFLYDTCHLAQLTWNFAFTVSETDENVLACAANKLKVSTDGGKTWHFDLTGEVTKGRAYDRYPTNDVHTGVHGDHHGLSIVGDHIWDGNDGGAYYSADGGKTIVKDKSDGLGIQELWGFGQSFKNDIMAVGLNHNRICFRDDEVYGGWIGVNGADAMAANVNPIDDQYMYTHPWGHQRVKRSLEGVKGHQFQDLGIELGYITLDNLEFHPHKYYTIYGSDYGDRNKTYLLKKTVDNAQSWQTISSFVDEKKNAVAVKTSFANSDYVYAVVEPNKVIKSTDEGTTWKEVSPPQSLVKDYALWRMAVSDQNPEHVWVTVKGSQNEVKVIGSKDGGNSWFDFSEGLPSYAIYSMIYQRGSNDILYVGTRLGVYYRKKGMKQWELFGEGMQAANTSFMFINYAKGKIRVGTSRGLWENDLVELTAPKANMSADKTEVSDKDPFVRFADYSVVDKEAEYYWEFPGGIPATSTEERPIVSYENASSGKYDVVLTVKDKRGESKQTLKGFVTRKADDSK
ncbi:BNR/Asp-box repeat-containing protein [Zhouia amylolytica]|uniref:BNR/Asp-box repeat-containing protein n=2 Tax=Zhouia amylolytica TaxID=376730 RepID=A0A1I6NYT0_9FLAO|nr:BNR/Asp-box repeat-containing protein [Zhouia amylolytica]